MSFYLLFLLYYVTGLTIGLVLFFCDPPFKRSDVSGISGFFDKLGIAGANVYFVGATGVYWPIVVGNIVFSKVRQRAGKRST